jgi:hypothetical protein
MLQVVHDVSGGTTRLLQVPEPLAVPAHLVVGIIHSAISAGTERNVVRLANVLNQAGGDRSCARRASR